MNAVQQYLGVNIDKIMSLEMRDQRPAQGTTALLYEAARNHQGAPLTMLAALQLVQRVDKGRVVYFFTGAGVPKHLPAGETDGPLGTAALARTLTYGLGAVPVVFTHPDYLDNVAAVLIAAGVGIRALDDAKEIPRTAALLPFPAGDGAAEYAVEALNRDHPAAMIAIEALGPNRVGVTHTSEGLPGDPSRPPFEHFVDAADPLGTLTIGVGDNGNEIGFGVIYDQVRAIRPYAAECRCPCGGGMATRVATNVHVAAGVSNWGAYGIAACVAALLGRPELLHDAEIEQFMLHEAIRTGAGGGGMHPLSVDGLPLRVHVAVLELMRAVIVEGLKPARVRGYSTRAPSNTALRPDVSPRPQGAVRVMTREQRRTK
jgi:hypothetical protein